MSELPRANKNKCESNSGVIPNRSNYWYNMFMADSLKNLLILAHFDEPAEIGIIKSFVYERYKIKPLVTIREKQIIIGVPSAALAGTLRMHLHELQVLCSTEKRLTIRISS